MNRMILAGAVAALLAVPAVAGAQSAVGFRGGIRSSGLSTGQNVSTVNQAVYGAYLGFGLTDRLALQFEVVYGSRGGDGLRLGADTLDTTAGPVGLDMQYIEVPVLLRAGFPTDRILASVFAGPYVGFLLSCEVTPDGGSATDCEDETAAQRFSSRNTDFGVVGGLGVDLALGENTLFIDARYTAGLLSIQAGTDAFDARHNGIAVTGGFALPLGN